MSGLCVSILPPRIFQAYTHVVRRVAMLGTSERMLLGGSALLLEAVRRRMVCVLVGIFMRSAVFRVFVPPF